MECVLNVVESVGILRACSFVRSFIHSAPPLLMDAGARQGAMLGAYSLSLSLRTSFPFWILDARPGCFQAPLSAIHPPSMNPSIHGFIQAGKWRYSLNHISGAESVIVPSHLPELSARSSFTSSELIRLLATTEPNPVYKPA